jgi:hypothetical protein
MLVTPIFNGQGLGNQLACYITTRVLALDKGYEFGVVYPERFKGHFFKNIELPEAKGFHFPIEGDIPITMPEGYKYYREKSVRTPSGDDISPYDEDLKQIGDNVCVHGLMQGEDYFKHRKDEIREWLKVEPLTMGENLCVINIRGGEYRGVVDFNLPKSYFENAISEMLKENPDMRFEIHTDDKEYAQQMFPEYPVISNMQYNWRSIRYAKYIILSNSSFGFFPAWLNEDAYVIAPKHWGRFNKGFWSIDQNYTEGWDYLDNNGNISYEK